jgi:hemolysin-activating ACP:hemolysin acyltransferase
MSRQVSAAFGDIVSVLMRSPGFKAMPLGELEAFVVPAVATGQFSVAQAQLKANGAVAPVGIVLWASVSPEIDQRLTAEPDKPIRLQASEWRSGNVVWIVEAAGDRRVIAAQLKQLKAREWNGRMVKLRVRGQDGRPAVRTLEAEASAA